VEVEEEEEGAGGAEAEGEVAGGLLGIGTEVEGLEGAVVVVAEVEVEEVEGRGGLVLGFTMGDFELTSSPREFVRNSCFYHIEHKGQEKQNRKK